MRLAISNIAWDPSEDLMVAKLLGKLCINAIDVAPGKYFPAPAEAKDTEISKVRAWWADRGIEITGMQALMFGTKGLNLFGVRSSREAMLDYLRDICRIGAGLGATRLVFGSPKNRDRSGLSDIQVREQSVSFFQHLGKVAQEYDVIICLEPNPIRYGANFMTTSEETIQIVEAVGHSSIRMQFDTGAITINEESPDGLLERSASLIGHVHASDPDLVPLGDGNTDHQQMYDALKKHIPKHLITIEMLATKEEPHLCSIERTLTYAVKHYRNKQVIT